MIYIPIDYCACLGCEGLPAYTTGSRKMYVGQHTCVVDTLTGEGDGEGPC